MADLMLEVSKWDLIPTQGGDIAVCTAPYAIAQAVANEIKLFQGEAYYAPDQGIPYDPAILGKPSSLSYVGELMQEAALGVDGVVSANPNIYLDGRTLRGAILVTDDSGIDLAVSV